MNQTHIHLLITHLPIFGSILGALVLVQGLLAKNNSTIKAAYSVFIISAIGAGIAYLTGEAAEETVENIQGVAKNRIEDHEDFAVFALISMIILGIAAIIGLFLNIKKSVLNRRIAILILFISLISFGLLIRTGYFGGQIRHTEINDLVTTQQRQSEEINDDD